MKAIRIHQFGGPEVLQYDSSVPVPKVESGSVLIRVGAVGVNPVDTYIRAGLYARKPSLPYIPGWDCAGVVEEVGAGVTKFKKGDRVFSGKATSGAYAEYTVALASTVQPLHSKLTFEQGAAIPVPYYTAYRALCIRAQAKPGETVLVHGASGGVGVAAVQIARSYGMNVLGTAGTLRGLEVVTQAGAHHVFNHKQDNYMEAIKTEAEKVGGVNIVIENAAHFNLGKDLPLLASGGRVAVVGSRGPVEVNPRDTMPPETSIMGVMLSSASEEERQQTFAAVQGGMEAGWLQPIVGKEFLLNEAAQAHREIIEGNALGKMVLVIQ
jgi:NADPH2:quinone reductase